ncbi:uncharacterized protein LOC143300250 [Babylonia areolata]|uniref:uncharacterized protein LOC143300250 n=1 Tax=Babylonia areolata TaxID=304850 RepID=UPI003FD22813
MVLSQQSTQPLYCIMNSMHLQQLQDRFNQNQQYCLTCQKPLAAENKSYRSHTWSVVSCSSNCSDILTRTAWAFVQGFLVSWVLCVWCKNTAADSEHEKDNSRHSFLSRTPDCERAEHKPNGESVQTGSSSSTAMEDDKSLLLLCEANCEELQMCDADLDTSCIPVHFEMDLLQEPSLNAHKDVYAAEHVSPVVMQDEEMFAASQPVSDKHPVTRPASGADSVQPGKKISIGLGDSITNTAADGIFSSQESSSSCNGVFSQTGENVKLDSVGTQESFCTEKSSVSTLTKSKKTANCKVKPASASLRTPLKTSQNEYRCLYCCKSFCTKSLLNQHIKSHSTENRSLQEESPQNFTCEFCAQIFMNRYSLKAHIKRKHSGEEPVECDICGKVQPGTFALSAHKKACHHFNSLCHICGAEFAGRTSFDKHMAGHEGIKRFFCDICGAGFVHNSSLNNHSSVHISTKSYQCDICSQMFKAQYLLNEHLLKTHQCGPSLEHRIRGLKKMGVEVDREAISRHVSRQCLVCGGLLEDGVCLSHPDSSQEVFHCPTCGDMTSNIVLFYQHVKWHRGALLSHSRRTSLSGESPIGHHLSSSGSATSASVIKCEVCSKTFKNFEYLSAHMHQHREARFVCDICSKRFTYKCNLKTHMNTHLDTWQFECEVCKKKFRDKYTLKKHQLKHTEPQFKCQVCGKALTRRPYLLKHYQKMHPEYQGSI